MPYTPAYAPGDVLTAAAMNSIGEAWTSTGSGTSWKAATNPTLGNGTFSMFYCQVNKVVHVRGRITMGSTTTYGTGAYRLDLPVTAESSSVGNLDVGGCVWADIGALAYGGNVYLASTTQAGFRFYEINGGLSIISLTEWASTANPFTLGNNDVVDFSFTYEAA